MNDSPLSAILLPPPKGPCKGPIACPISGDNRALKPLVAFACLFLLFLLCGVELLKAPRVVSYVYLGASAFAFLAYWFDKKTAEKERTRIRETVLLASGLVGGWPGALLSQQFFRHKTRKQPFQALFWITVLMNLAALGWLWQTWR